MQGLKYNVDMVLCIDATGSMSSIIDKVKSSALKFYEDLAAGMEKERKTIDSLRVKVISYRDYYVDGDKSMLESPFFVLPDEKEAFSKFVSGIHAEGGGDEPENGLEALALAMKSDWSKGGDKRRHVVVVWTDTSAHPLEKQSGAKPSVYPSGLPSNFDEITDLWDGQGTMNFSAKRMLIYSPDAYPWTDISTHWENIIHHVSKAGDGLSEVEYGSIIDAIAQTV